jgi:hypothetical protein
MQRQTIPIKPHAIVASRFVPNQLVDVLCEDNSYATARIANLRPGDTHVGIWWNGQVVDVLIDYLKARRGRRPGIKNHKVPTKPPSKTSAIEALVRRLKPKIAEHGERLVTQGEEIQRLHLFVGVLEAENSDLKKVIDSHGRLLGQLRDQVRTLMGHPTPFAAPQIPERPAAN